ncbi:autotransporter outer membrane beta-barrel domain-containing protein [Synechococcus sp. RS9916]|uniref:autotransporter outer membrane beta-barrel domain-containing protein n=1 Tax=Synechococcus sp. RS9916 TaxID=221359 RepID=UPI0002DD9877|nr:autotransporter outer membrane beta-barrel domain-containing protein [Synechococcus sp. RS9916]
MSSVGAAGAGAGSHGVLLQSIGGGGGTGGRVIGSNSATTTSNTSFSLGGGYTSGGDAGGGGSAGSVSLGRASQIADLQIQTQGHNAHAVFLQSLGGGGGAGGSVNNASAEGGNLNASFAIGGTGGGGGNASGVNFYADGTFITKGDTSYGVLLQSIGGGGGQGGSVTSNVAAGTGNKTANSSFTLGAVVGEGAIGGGGGSSGDINGSISGNVATSGAGSIGFFAQSVGGGGGAGGSVTNSASAQGEAKFAASATFGMGGKGGDGGNSGSINFLVPDTLTIVTGGGTAANASSSMGSVGAAGAGAGSHGLLLQSIGGGGGTGGSVIGSNSATTTSNTSFSLGGGYTSGGDAGGGGSAGSVSLGRASQIADLQIQTQGDNAHAVFLQSIGGGGGAGGSVNNASAGGNLNASFAIGGTGGGGGNASGVNFYADGTFITKGDTSYGVLLQSIGGGGGQGGSVTSNVAAGTGNKTANSSFTLGAVVGKGAIGGGGGRSGDINGSISGNVATSGAGSIGFFAQSVGGGGGAGGSVTNSASAQGEAKFAASATFGMGGKGGKGGSSGSINFLVPDTLTIVTGGGTAANASSSMGSVGAAGAGAGSHGLLLQSIGGGGGTGGSVIGSNSATTTSNTSFSLGGGYTSGGDAGGGGSAGSVSLGRASQIADLQIQTQGHNAHAVFLQSLGGGGGAGGSVNNASAEGGNLNASFAIGGTGGGGGNASGVNFYADGTFITKGDTSYGVLLQSIGGGGGQGGSVTSNVAAGTGNKTANSSFTLGAVVGKGAIGGGGGRSGDINGSISGNVATSGAGSIGFFAQSVGGGGGAGGSVTNSASAQGEAKFAASATFGMGGKGGKGGSSGSINFLVPDTLTIVTGGGTAANASSSMGSVGAAGAGAGSHGLLLQSIGGGGGTGGSVIGSNSATTTSNTSFSLGGGYTSGGDGGGGGSAGSVSLGRASQIADLQIQTQGHNAHAVFLQSLGGGGGAGGSVNNASAEGGNLNASFAIGGTGGGGGNASGVNFYADGTFITKGDTSYGVLLQSIGGGGGQGGSVTSNVAAGTGNKTANSSFTLGAVVGEGAIGGGGGRSGDINGSISGNVATSGAGSIGFFAQSVGGGGGAGGSVTNSASAQGEAKFAASATFGMGGKGGDGGNSGSINFLVPKTLTIVTGGGTAANASSSMGSVGAAGAGAGSHGLLLQSIGGGGGTGGSVIGSNSATTTSNTSFSLGGDGSSGGSGGGGGSAGSVSLGRASQIADLQIQTSGDNSNAVFLQSIGGGGGAGGSVNNASAGGNLSASFAIGGQGGDGGAAGVVSAYLDGTFITKGASSYGVLLQSIGGGGGQGGAVTSNASASATSANSKFSLGASVPIGGAGGSGSWGQTVQGSISGAIQTAGDSSIGFFAQSVGGGGGAGASVTNSATASGSSRLQASASVTMGGAGGSGGSGGQVAFNVPEDLTVITGNASTGTGAGAHGLLLQSIGGGGGASGSVLSSNVATGTSNTSFTLGASGALTRSGGNGGSASSVSLGRASQIADLTVQTSGDAAHALFLQSIGGGGGAAGSINSGSASGNISAAMAMGGSGGNGGQAGSVSLFADATLLTQGAGSYGVLLQSIGGGGGQGGSITGNASASAESANAKFAFGADASKAGDGGVGGQAADVNARLSGNISTTGTQAIGVFAQSVGGGGGAGGSITSSATNSGNATYSASATFGFGGKGGNGASAGDVSLITNAGKTLTVSTTGQSAKGILLQSIGGGGGQGGAIHSNATSSTTNATLGGLGVGESGAGGAGGNSGTVSLNAADLIIRTTGNNAVALLAQSIGGGGGSAGTNVNNVQGGNIGINVGIGASGGAGGNSGAVNLNIQDGTILTSGNNATALYVQSVGGGGGSSSSFVGGSSASNIAINGTIGGSGGAGGNSGSVTIVNAADIQTLGDNAVAIYAQSVGGGGGETSIAAPSSSADNTISGSLQVGGSAGGGGSASNVSVTNRGLVITKGSQSHGVFSQSVGGGGGRVSIATQTASEGTEASISFGGSGGDGGDAGNVSVTNSGLIDVSGPAAYGIYAQSVGGGGGSLSSTAAMSASLGGSGGGGGNSGNITITNAAGADIVTRGDNAVGVFALAIGGGGGDIGASQDSLSLGASGGKGGNAGNITITNNGNITTLGDGSYGVVAKSIAGGGGRATANINEGTLSLGGSGGSGGTAGTVTLRNTGNIATYGTSSIPVYLSSVGAGGGDVQSGFGDATLGSNGATGQSGKSTLINTGTLLSNNAFSPAILHQAVGGGGGSADSANGTVVIGSANATSIQSAQAMTLRNEGSLITLAQYSPAIFAQAIGGGGGRIAQTSGGNVTIGSTDAAASADLSGGSINISSTGKELITKGDYSQALSAQSIGGGGGWVGTVQGNLIVGAQNSAAPMDSGSITVTNRSLISTSGNISPGISLQSIGGGGAYTGQIGGAAQLGSISSSGSQNAGKVSLTNTGSVQTTGNFSPLINVQSIGGGGGRTGDIGTTLNLGAVNLIGASANGADVTVNNTGELLISKGLSSPALLAQSIGGGGGAAAEVTGNVTMGASGTGIANAGSVRVTNSSKIQTSGNNSIGLLAQSIGGGGGVAGLSAGDAVILGGSLIGNASGSRVSVTNTGDITTTGINAAAFLAQSIGGGGGAAAKSLGSLSRLGASAGDIADADSVSVTNRGKLQTSGNGSPALMVQSIAGGGGYIAETNAQAKYNVTLAGSNLTSANAGDVSVTNNAASVITVGAYSPALVAQSIGGGGGWSLLRSTPNAQLGSEAGSSLRGGNVTLTSTTETLGSTAAFSTAAVIQSVGGGGGVTGSALGNVTLGASQTTGNLSSGSVTASLTSDAITEGQNSAAMVVQTIAGGGGLGAEVTGNATLGMTSAASSTANAGSISFQGKGNLIATKGIDSPGIVLQSIAGGGGWLGNIGGNAALGASHIGEANAGAIQATINYDSIQTAGENSTGLLAQSIGGGGGFVGSTSGSSLTLGSTVAASSSSDTGEITLLNRADITTIGINSAALIAQSIGGGGGAAATNDGDSIRMGSISTAVDASALPLIKTGNVTVTNTSNLRTSAIGSAALLAQSIAGGGGYIAETSGSDEYTITFGANGNINATAGDVTVNNSGELLFTAGNYSPAIVAQSIGGGGGFALISAKSGGSTRIGSINNGLGKANSGNVSVTNNALLYTQGNFSTALTAQTIGGGGGVINSAASSLELGTKNHKGAAAAGNIDVTNTNLVQTDGNYSSGIIVQTIGSGGGFIAGSSGGSAVLGAVNGLSDTLGNSGDLTLNSKGKSIKTSGSAATAILAQSIGGGGGFVGATKDGATLGGTRLANISAGNVTVRNSSTIYTSGRTSAGLFAQSIGGGGGFIGTTSNENVDLGGEKLRDAVAGNITVANSGDITTTGVNSTLLAVQSIGGGGGKTTLTENTPTASAGSVITLGDQNSVRSRGGSITVTNSGNLRSSGRSSTAIAVQSVGGGGGILKRLNVNPLGSDFQLGSTQNKDGSGGNIELRNTGQSVITQGDFSRAILVQSIGAGGGWLAGSHLYTGTAILGAVQPSGKAHGGELKVVNKADITTAGLSSGGITIQSIGGGGGLIGRQAGSITMGLNKGSGITDGGSVDINNSGFISTKGEDAPGLLVQSIGGGGGRANRYESNAQLGLTGNGGQLQAKSGNINLRNSGDFITTEGYNSPAIAIQTIAGGGGYIGSQLTKDPSNLTGSVGAGKYLRDSEGKPIADVRDDVMIAGNIDASNSADLKTTGEISPGLVAQSIGGGGGYAGGMNADIITLGTNGPVTTKAGNLTVNNTGTISTTGRGSGALLTQSIGGGGGFLSSQTMNEMFMGSLYTNESTSGNVQLTNSGSLYTEGVGSIGLLAQSIGGGGGVNAYSEIEDLEAGASNDRIFLSGSDAKNSGSGNITVTNTSTVISTKGKGAPAMLIQSVGGGGGWAALANADASNLRLGSDYGSNGNGGDINFTNTADIATLGFYSQAIRIQSVGGGGGAIAASGNEIRFGSKAMAGKSSGGAIKFTNSGSISTEGNGSTGVNIMSLGGGGGTIFGIATDTTTFGTNSPDLTINANGGDLEIKNTGTFITTKGESASAILAISGGGGGGFLSEVQGNLLGGANTQGDTKGGSITLTNSATLSTTGAGSIGLAAMSHGGGSAVTGPVSGGNELIAIGSIGSSDSSSGDLSITNNASISTADDAAPALLLQSIAGGGVYAPIASDPDFIWLGNSSKDGAINNGGSITLTTKGNILTQGVGSQALIAQSIGGGGGFFGDIAPNATGESAALLGSQGYNDKKSVELATIWQNEWLKFTSKITKTDPNWLKNLDNLDATDKILRGEIIGLGGGGDAASIDINISGDQYRTEGDNSSVVLLQSIGGGGGWLLLDQGNNYTFLGSLDSKGGVGGAINATTELDLISLGANSPAFVAQSIGGGGGATGDSNLMARIGSTSAHGNNSAGDITIDHNGTISTKGIFSSGLLAQSIGGGGGLSGSISGAVSMGYKQNDADYQAKGGSITLTTAGGISTAGNHSPALVAQSIGGGGGWVAQAGGQVDLGSFSITNNSDVSAGAISITSSSDLVTQGDNSTGLLAQSIAGGGGFLGINTTIYRTNLGGKRAGTANAADVTINNSGSITTSGNNSAALLAQSIGGGGGSAALTGSPDLSITKDNKLSLSATGTASSLGGNLNVSNTSNLITSGNGSPALLLQSIGGGGGVVQALNSAAVHSIRFGYLNAGQTPKGAASSAGAIEFTSTGGSTIATAGNRSAAAILQSIGGGGGWALIDSLTTSTLGAKGTEQATGAPITANVNGTLQTTGNTSPGFVVQTIGGGGGFAGNVSGNATLGGLNLSGANGIAGSSDALMPIACRFGSCEVQTVDQAVLVDIQGDLITTGVTSPVMLVQAIGGGGGRLGTVTGNATLGMSLSSGDNDGGAIRVVSNAGASLSSRGNDSAALVIQSIGGGGGTVNSIGGNATLGGTGAGTLRAGAITLNGPFAAATQGINSPGVVLQSIGGGGGLAADVDGDLISFGTSSTADTSASDVTAISANWQISTQGLNSPGLILQSIGGGGGVAYTSSASVNLGGAVIGNTSSGDLSLTSKFNSRIQTTGVSSPALIAQTIGGGGGYVGGDGTGRGDTVTLGGTGQQIGSSGSIDLFFSGGSTLITTGLQSQGVIAQSIAGGGGFTSQNGKTMRLGVSGGTGNAGSVLITHQGTISTSGNYSEGLIAQSISGGGGNAGSSSLALSMGGIDAFGDASDVTVNNTGGTIVTAGDYSAGVVAQSVGAGGGRIGSASGQLTLGGDNASGDAGNVTINNTAGTIATAGDYSPSYLMQSVGGGGGMVGLGDSTASGTVILGGGTNGTAGSGGTLTLVEGGGILQATGLFSPGVIHQSIGGGGGWIGSVPAGTVQLGGLTTGKSTGADLELTLPFAVATFGANSPGALLQSIGGGGGIVADVGGDVVIGGTQQLGVDASAGDLNYTQLSRTISTAGNDSPGVVLQSIGGGGGLLGAVDGSVITGSTSAEGSDVRGGAITATSAAPISTSGVSSPGFTIQSIGGSGALIGSAPTSVTAGGSGLGDSRSGAINFTNSGAISTAGINSSGVILQSIAGGGLYTTSAGGNAIRLGGSVIGTNDSAAISFSTTAPIATAGSNSAAVVAQSIAGGGGAVFGLADASATTLTLGGSNATDNQASTIDLAITGDLSTFGDFSPALIAQSIGGGGGYAPLPSASATLGSISSINLDAGAITVDLNADLRTTGFGSDGLLLQSIGAGGGVAGATTTSLTMGASALANGDAADITINTTGTITTTGDQSIGISAQSIGAGGGRAGTAAGSVTLGGNGATGNAGNVTLNLAANGGNGSILTTGTQSPAFVLQSVGGGGGLVFPSTNTSSGDLLLGGGDLGTSGSGGTVAFTAGGSSSILTTGAGSSGLTYQSIGGGGGYTGSTTANAQLGGLYRATSTGAALTLASQIDSATNGIDASALLIQSIGGGGGRAGDIGGTAVLGGTSTNALLTAPEAQAGALSITLNSNLSSAGDRSAAAMLQTIGGGGGTAGAIGGDATLGGLGTGNRSAGNLTITADNRISSAGSFSPALLAQTIGGGGGSVDTVGGNLTLGRTTALTEPNTGNTSAGDLSLTVNSAAQILSTGNTSPALIAQTIGGGGGYAASTTGTVQLGAGGAGTTAANAAAGAISWSNAAGGTTEEVTELGIVPITTAGIATSGNLSPAVVLQSIGGGGGYTTGGTSVSFSAAGHAGTSTSSGDIEATNTGIISTTGDNSFGVLLQTIGGGGGVGGSSTGAVSLSNTNANSSSGNITFTNSGTIATSGTGSHAVVAQTIAGSGGFVFGGARKENAISLLGNPTGSSGDITVNNSGTISASGDGATALLFQNAAGGAYLYQNAGGFVSNITQGATDGLAPAGQVVVINTGTIVATGQGGVGITKSTSDLSGNLRVDNAEGAVIQGGDGGSAINLPTGDVERINNYGTIIGGSDGSSDAITGPGGPDEINNYGTISGDIIIPGLTRNIYNAPGARLESNLVLANGNVTLTQRGTVNPGGEYRIGNLKVYANYETTDTSLYEADLVLRSGETDNLTTHYRADLNGTVELLANQVGQAMPGTFISQGIINAQEGITIGDLKLIAPKSAVASFGFDLIENRTDLAFKYTVDYAPKGLDPNSTAVGKAVNTIQAAGSTSAFNSTAALIFAQETTKELNSLYRQLSGATSAAFPQVALATGQAFQAEVQETLDSAVLSQLQRCILNVQSLKPGDTYTGDPADCGKWRTWVNAGGSDATTPGSGTSDQSGYSTNAFNTSVGADTLVGDNTLIGIAGRFDNLWTTTTEPTTFGKTEGWSGMLYAKQRLTPATWLSGSFSAGGFSTDITRQVNIPGYPSTEQGSSSSTAIGGSLRLSHLIDTGNQGSLTPSLGLSWLQLNQAQYSETTTSNNTAYVQPGNPLIKTPNPGKASYALTYDAATYNSIPLEIGLSYKQPFKAGSTTLIPRISLGYAWDLGNTNRSLTARFNSAPKGSFTVDGTPAPSSWFNVGLGLDLAINDRFSVYINGLGQLSPSSTQSINYGGGFRWSF